MVFEAAGLLDSDPAAKRPDNSCVQEPPPLVVRKMPCSVVTTIVPEVTGSADTSKTAPGMFVSSAVHRPPEFSVCNSVAPLVALPPLPGMEGSTADFTGKLIDSVCPAA